MHILSVIFDLFSESYQRWWYWAIAFGFWYCVTYFEGVLNGGTPVLWYEHLLEPFIAVWDFFRYSPLTLLSSLFYFFLWPIALGLIVAILLLSAFMSLLESFGHGCLWVARKYNGRY
jgi:hypothetical protein